MRQKQSAVLRCSFCHKPESEIRKLVSSPSDYPRAYICDECIRVCAYILEDDLGPSKEQRNTPPPEPARVEPQPESVLGHPMAAELLERVEQWVKQDASGHGASAELNQLRTTAKLVFIAPDV